MKLVLRTAFAAVAGMVLAFALVVAVEAFSAVVHPFPANFDGNVPAHVRRYPHWVLAVVVPAWSGTAFAAVWLATWLGTRVSGWTVALLLAAALAFNLTMLPYVLWFKLAMAALFPLACVAGLRAGVSGPSRSATSA
jgi:hypothetical protein